MPTEAELEKYYRDDYRWDYQFARSGPSRRHLMRRRREAQRRLTFLAPALRSGARVLDFGAGAGAFLGAAKVAGHSVLGIEPGEDYARFARDTFGVSVIISPWKDVAQSIGPFDVITAVEVLEHLRRPVSALRWLASLLAPEGVIYITVPNSLPGGGETFRKFHFAHVHSFTPTTLAWAAQACGLEYDPRFAARGTCAVFRKAAVASPPLFDRNHGSGLTNLYPNDKIGPYILSGRWLAGRARQLKKTVRDTLSS